MVQCVCGDRGGDATFEPVTCNLGAAWWSHTEKADASWRKASKTFVETSTEVFERANVLIWYDCGG